ncbi:MAG: sulfatase-like hydrolase/transferase [Planctomycetota bacterium]
MSNSPAWAMAQSSSGRLNVVIILSDDQGYNSLAATGCTDFKMPNLDRLVTQGTRMRQCYTSAPVCSPTRAALLTGNYQQRIDRVFDWVVGILDEPWGLPASEPTLARMLKKRGYVTGIFGKWHLGGVPEKWPTVHGFDEFKGFVGGNLDFWTYENVRHQHGLFDGDKPIKPKGYLTDLITDWSIDFIKRHKKEAFFLYIPYNAPHWPYQGYEKGLHNLNRDPKGNWTNWAIAGGSMEIYRSMMERLDHGIGRVLKALDDNKLTNNTLVIFFSDNGGDTRYANNQPLRGFKCDLYEGGVRVPCVFRWPGKIPADRVCDQPIITMDITATVLAATGTPRDPKARPADGIDVLPIITGQVPPRARRFFWYSQPPGKKPTWRAIRDGDWKLVRQNEKAELFNLKDDPAESKDLTGQNPAKLKELNKLYAQWEATLPSKSNK